MQSVWNGKDCLTDSLERDYAAMTGDGWELIWEPTSPLTTPWDELARLSTEPRVESEITLPKRDREVQAAAKELRNEIAAQMEIERRAVADMVSKTARKHARRGLRIR